MLLQLKGMASKPRLGQNFLADPSASLAIVEALGDISASTVVEIGPGKGAITRLLSTRARRLIAIELDDALAAQLGASCAGSSVVEVLHEDVLTVSFSALQASPTEKLIIVGNLPYYITSPILLHLFRHYDAIDRAVIMVQREVADRIAAHPGSRDYGLLTATTQLYAAAEPLFTLPPRAFSPPPDVYSTVLRLVFRPRFRELGVDPPAFIQFLKQSFAQKRKTLVNNLRSAGISPGEIVAALNEQGVPLSMRAEALPLAAAANIFLALQKQNLTLPKEKGRSVEDGTA